MLYPENGFPLLKIPNPEVSVLIKRTGVLVWAYNVDLNKKIQQLLKDKRSQHKLKYRDNLKVYYFFIDCPIPRLREIDLSEPDNYAENFERLLRWIYDKPLYKKPEIGKMPSFLSEGKQILLGTTVSFRRAINVIKDGKPYSAGALKEYFEIFVQNLEKFRIKNYKGEFDEAIMKNIEAFLPYRNEVIQIFSAIARYSPKEEHIESLNRFFESLIPYMFRPERNGHLVFNWRCLLYPRSSILCMGEDTI
ncbi:unnamed protein product [marine sediment metagenome]|uniref:Uncharacterized protein n=1 Tax=marine sediment metagenome TaxID=412755 RepID=X0ZY62_9ZZZZ